MTPRRYTKERLEVAATGAATVQDVLRNLRVPLAGGTHALISRRLQEYGIPIPTHRGRGSTNNPDFRKRTTDEILRIRPAGGRRAHTYQLRRALIERGRVYECEECGQGPMWNDKPLVLPIDHRDGDAMNCLEENLRFLCLHCHSQTETYCRNRRDVA